MLRGPRILHMPPPFAQQPSSSPSLVNRSNVIFMGHTANDGDDGHKMNTVIHHGLAHEAPNHATQCHLVHDHDDIDKKLMVLPNPDPNPNPNPNPNCNPNPNTTLFKRLKIIQPEDHPALNLNMQVMLTHHNDNHDDNSTLTNTTNNHHHNNRICNNNNQLDCPANYVATDYKGSSSSSHISSGLGRMDQTNTNLNNHIGSGTKHDQEEIKIKLDLTLNSSSSSSNSSSSCHDHDHKFSLSLSSNQLTSVKLLNLLV